ncbi:biotin--protein ligase-like [Artemia franciscana]|uniref:biotin--protein ligase-like n=1 Tax=Artemia franciscana TaxID=6661 RepID=UPI0032DA470A
MVLTYPIRIIFRKTNIFVFSHSSKLSTKISANCQRKMSTNILVFSHSSKLKDVIEAVVSHNHYTVYGLKRDDLLSFSWLKNCKLLIFHGESICLESVKHFVERGGTTLQIIDAPGPEGMAKYDCVVVERSLWQNVQELKKIIRETLYRLDIQLNTDDYINALCPTPLHLFGGYSSGLALTGLRKKWQIDDLSQGAGSKFDWPKFSQSHIMFCHEGTPDQTRQGRSRGTSDSFQITFIRYLRLIFKALRTKELGKSVIFGEVVTSTMDIAEEIEDEINGIIVVSHVQLAGKGRSGNKWISPKGAVTFTVRLLKPRSFAFGNISLLQHAASLAVVQAIRRKRGYEDFPVALKWPNDIYIQKDKVGGVLTKCSIGKDICCLIGLGVNFDNPAPSVSVNQCLQQYGLAQLSSEEFVADILNQLENLIDLIENHSLSSFKELYYKYWMHSQSPVKLKSENGLLHEGKILGIDNYGYLLVQVTDNTVVEVHPDGNSFDLLEGLIMPKFKPT